MKYGERSGRGRGEARGDEESEELYLRARESAAPSAVKTREGEGSDGFNGAAARPTTNTTEFCKYRYAGKYVG